MSAPRWLPLPLAVLVGALVLWLLNAALDPVPVAAAPAFLLGATALIRPAGSRLPTIAGMAAAGAVLGMAIHWTWHANGSSPAPAGALAWHVAGEGALGLAAALLALAAGHGLLRAVR